MWWRRRVKSKQVLHQNLLNQFAEKPPTFCTNIILLFSLFGKYGGGFMYIHAHNIISSTFSRHPGEGFSTKFCDIAKWFEKYLNLKNFRGF